MAGNPSGVNEVVRDTMAAIDAIYENASLGETHEKEPLYDEARHLVSGDRRESYGPIAESFQRVAAAYTGILMGRTISTEKPVTPQEVALMFIVAKCVREANQHKRDNIVDIYGYSLCLETMV